MTQSFTKDPILSVSAGNGWVFLDSATAASATSIDFTSSINSVYNLYCFIFDQIVSDTNGDLIVIRTKPIAGGSFDSGATDYSYGVTGSLPTSSSGSNSLKTAQTGTAAGQSINGHVFLYNPANTNYTAIEGTTTGLAIYTKFNGLRKSSVGVEGFQMFGGTDNISGTIKMYGCCTPA